MRQFAAVIALVTLVSSALTAQLPNTREGIWFAVGLGGGSIGADCANCGTDRTNGYSGNLRIGATVNPSMLLGVELTGWNHASGGVDQNMRFGSAVILWYPSPVGAFFTKFGVGAMTYTADDGTDKITATAPSVSFGLGYDIRASSALSITPFFNSLASTNATFKLNNSTTGFNSSIKLNLFQIGIGLSWH